MARPVALIVHPEEELAKGAAQYLELEGFRCLVATSGAEGVKVLETTPVTAVVLDSDVTKPDGLALCRDLREGRVTGREEKSVVIVVLIGGDSTADEAIEAGATAAIEKPYHLASVAATLRQLVPDLPPPRL